MQLVIGVLRDILLEFNETLFLLEDEFLLFLAFVLILLLLEVQLEFLLEFKDALFPNSD